jgi:hypothetical protein
MSTPIEDLEKLRDELASDADRSKAKASLKPLLDAFIDRQEALESNYRNAYNRLRPTWLTLLNNVKCLHFQLMKLPLSERDDVFVIARSIVKPINEIVKNATEANPVRGKNEEELVAADAWKKYVNSQLAAWQHNETGVEKQLQLCSALWNDIDKKRLAKQWGLVTYCFYARLVPELFSLCVPKELADPDDKDLPDSAIQDESERLMAIAEFGPATRTDPDPKPIPSVPPDPVPFYPSPRFVHPSHLIEAILKVCGAYNLAVDVYLGKKAQFDASPDNYASLVAQLADSRNRLENDIAKRLDPTPATAHSH